MRWTNGETVTGAIHREGNLKETITVANAPHDKRQSGNGDYAPLIVTLYFSLWDGPWACTQALVEGRIIRKDGCLSDKYTVNRYPDPGDKDPFNTAPPWLQHLAVSRLAVLGATTGARK